ncbi:MAG: AAA family ATPase, partial [Marivivens sp.]|nr:AAA family ATPase [Marivivens sp.]
MSQSTGQMELREDDIRSHYPAALSLLQGFDHAPRIGATTAVAEEKSSGIGTRRAFRSTTPGLVTQRTTRSEGVRLVERINGLETGDGLTSPLQAAVLQGLRRGIAVALAVTDQYGERTGLAELKRANLQGGLPAAKSTEFSELLTAEALIALQVFASYLSFTLASHASEDTVEIGSVDEVLTENAPLALQGVLWELDQDIARFATSESRLVATTLAYAEALMEKV